MVVDADLGDHASIWMCLLPGAGSCRWLRCVVDPGGLQNLVRNQKKGEKELALFLSGPTCLVRNYEHPDTQSLVCLEKPGCDIIAEIVGGIAEESCFRFSVDVGDKVG